MLNENSSKNSAIKLLFNPSSSEYNLFYSNKQSCVVSTYLNKNSIGDDALVIIKKRIESIKFMGLNSLIDFCRNEKIFNLQIVFEWINFFIYREERKHLEIYRSLENNLVMGISNLIEFIKIEDEEMIMIYGFKCYQSEIRTNLIKLIKLLISCSDIFQGQNEFDYFINTFTLNIFALNFDEVEALIREAMSSKDKKVKIKINF